MTPLMTLLSFAQTVIFIQGTCKDTIVSTLSTHIKIDNGTDVPDSIHIKYNEEFSVANTGVQYGYNVWVYEKQSNNNVFGGATDTSFTFSEKSITSGTFYLVYNDGDNHYIKLIVGEKTECEYQTTLTVSNIEKEDIGINIYPNPVVDIMNVVFETSVLMPVELYTLSGQLLYTETYTCEGRNEVQLNVTNFAPGMYLVKVGNAILKTIKQ